MAGRGKLLKRLNDENESLPPEQTETVELLAKYSYKANPEKPGGFDEISMKQGEKVWLVKKGSDNNKLWWEIRKDDGSTGYVPAQYVMVIEKKVTSLPWLNQSTQKEKSSQENALNAPKFKPYVSAYNSDTGKQKESEEEFYCKICERKFNGPIPFRAHMNSKGHKEEEEIAQRY